MEQMLQRLDEEMAAQSFTEQPELLEKYVKATMKLSLIACMNLNSIAKTTLAQRVIEQEF